MLQRIKALQRSSRRVADWTNGDFFNCEILSFALLIGQTTFFWPVKFHRSRCWLDKRRFFDQWNFIVRVADWINDVFLTSEISSFALLIGQTTFFWPVKFHRSRCWLDKRRLFTGEISMFALLIGQTTFVYWWNFNVRVADWTNDVCLLVKFQCSRCWLDKRRFLSFTSRLTDLPQNLTLVAQKFADKSQYQ